MIMADDARENAGRDAYGTAAGGEEWLKDAATTINTTEPSISDALQTRRSESSAHHADKVWCDVRASGARFPTLCGQAVLTGDCLHMTPV